MAENKFSNLKSSLKQTADKIKSSESAEKIINSETVNKAKSTLADTTEKIKNTDAYDKAMSTVNDVADKVANTEMGQKTKGVVDTAKSKNPKASKLIKIGAVALILIIILGAIIPNIGFNKKDAEYQLEQHLLSIGTVTADSIKINCIDTYKGKPTAAAGEHKLTGKVYILDVHYSIMDGVYGDIEYNYVYGGYEKEDGSYLFSTLAGYKNSNGDPDNNYSSRNKAKKELMKTLKKVVK